MSNKAISVLYANIPQGLKTEIKKQAIDLNLSIQEYVIIALSHYKHHIDNNEIDFNNELV